MAQLSANCSGRLHIGWVSDWNHWSSGRRLGVGVVVLPIRSDQVELNWIKSLDKIWWNESKIAAAVGLLSFLEFFCVRQRREGTSPASDGGNVDNPFSLFSLFLSYYYLFVINGRTMQRTPHPSPHPASSPSLLRPLTLNWIGFKSWCGDAAGSCVEITRPD